jgi:hypothetical protein
VQIAKRRIAYPIFSNLDVMILCTVYESFQRFDLFLSCFAAVGKLRKSIKFMICTTEGFCFSCKGREGRCTLITWTFHRAVADIVRDQLALRQSRLVILDSETVSEHWLSMSDLPRFATWSRNLQLQGLIGFLKFAPPCQLPDRLPFMIYCHSKS